MTDPKIDLKTPWIAGVLAYLVPGAGHFYQRRYFKAVLYFVCVYGTFLYGMALGDWKVVYWTENAGGERFGQPAKRNYGYLCQVGVGCPSLYAYMQTRRYRQPENRPAIIGRAEVDVHTALLEPVDAEFQGDLVEFADPHEQNSGKRKFAAVRGRIHLEPHNRIFKGTFKGTIEREGGQTEPFECNLGESLFLDSKILGDPERKLAVGVLNENGQYQGNDLIGTVPRAFLNWFEAPLDVETLRDLNGNLTKQFEMALLYTWIAGLLNVLVIWDAVQGPAYGYDDEAYRQSKKSKKNPKPKDVPPGDAAPAESSEATADASTNKDGDAAGDPEGEAVSTPTSPQTAGKAAEN